MTNGGNILVRATALLYRKQHTPLFGTIDCEYLDPLSPSLIVPVPSTVQLLFNIGGKSNVTDLDTIRSA